MSFTPKFMRSLRSFDRERRALRTAAEWYAFRMRWFDREKWPEKPRDQIGKELTEGHQLVSEIRDGRRWAPGIFTIDITPEARYHYFWTLNTIGQPLLDPRWSTIKKSPETGWRQECGYCFISTQDQGEPTCPRCGRELYWQWVAE